MTDVPPDLLAARGFTTERLELRPLTRDEVEAACQQNPLPQFHPEFPTPNALDILQGILASGEFFFTDSAYSPLACIERESGLLIGLAGWAAPPIDESLEIGGFLVPSHTGRGYAAEALPYLISLGFEDPQVSAIRASLPQEQSALEAFLRRQGFERIESAGTETEFLIRRSERS